MSIFDAHFHIIDPRFPLVPNHGYLPDPFPISDYQPWVQKLGINGGVVVSGSFQAFDQTYLIDALKTLGKNYVGVTQISVHTADSEIFELAKAGVKGIRFNVKRGGSESLARIRELANRVYDLVGWHAELYIDAKEIDEFLFKLFISLPKISIDHLGLSKEGLPTMIKLAENGVKIKATGFGRVDFDVPIALRMFAKADPTSLMFGTDLPSTRSRIPFSEKDLETIQEVFEGELLDDVLGNNARKFYGVES
ncbi:2-pyrone-4,6-dicarboxylate hydrolase [Leptospira perolatii]|uniref:2-pyrone-4,6-dicarboxylate hydrolase n=1 Tax=Leptospira perolatii TaxID=2023191 RepID=A0A2M9ZSD0_9LEPT|nr:amidohydrolase family protein [Leptospira perolatii]PJZ71438.1 2-pyrone-4,6-dicarboxylate hydrolase [Leptospira perolatii]PJZ74972.1 2-pyrone-4,6-dicarboxylate hydrolase [Leptospira perolatii]